MAKVKVWKMEEPRELIWECKCKDKTYQVLPEDFYYIVRIIDGEDVKYILNEITEKPLRLFTERDAIRTAKSYM